MHFQHYSQVYHLSVYKLQCLLDGTLNPDFIRSMRSLPLVKNFEIFLNTEVLMKFS